MLINLIRKLRYFFKNGYKHLYLKKRGNLVVAENAIIDACEIIVARAKSGWPNIHIGENCNISCRFVILNPEAKVIIGDRVFIGNGTVIFCYENIIIDDDVMISWGCTITDTNAHSIKASERIHDVIDWNRGEQYKDWSKVIHKATKISKSSWVGFNSVILKGVDVGEGSIVGAASVVTKSVQPYSIVAGNPAIYVRDAEK